MSFNGRAIWLVDGFNLYHSLRRCEKDTGRGLRWLNLWELAAKTQPTIGSDCRLTDVYYFTALPHHLTASEPKRLERHEAYVRALTAWRPTCLIKLGHFQPRREAGKKTWHEKGTDMAIGATVIRAAIQADAEEIIIVSGDSDFVPLAELIKELFPKIRLRFAFPAHRTSLKLAQICPGSFHLRAEAYARAQFPDIVQLPSGKHVVRPANWA
jgi:uncharacterized LabA/DUF88 family protein